jgi:hypothetical protein
MQRRRLRVFFHVVVNFWVARGRLGETSPASGNMDRHGSLRAARDARSWWPNAVSFEVSRQNLIYQRWVSMDNLPEQFLTLILIFFREFRGELLRGLNSARSRGWE